MFSFGDIVVNEWASLDNPNRRLLYVRSDGKWVHLLNHAGAPVKFFADDELRLAQVGRVDIPLLLESDDS
jgi:hypothetical protein